MGQTRKLAFDKKHLLTGRAVQTQRSLDSTHGH